ncbi:phosphoribosyl-dephospho-CoA transferase [Cystobacter fuscus]|uniref:Phosphoribosyl-dephospho-CoA transferase n=1 Tax=Cystobacter fuscus TaxID=43 RepID=A0A250JBI5_9BACT|nr:malonate decarboxylase holo-[acyl-carrier-protein] synthase [Cystobacter fuscus]ATB40938.1 phosphoribosyl-dephospho-CoA transferase [Cystobacter fuscus]
MTCSEPLTRHHWVRLDAGWEHHLRSPLAPEAREQLLDWCGRGRPFVVARADAADTEEDVRLGLALPDKRRIALHVGRAAVLSSRPPLALRDVWHTAPESWRSVLRHLSLLGETLGVPVGVFGSLAWEYLSGVRYVRPDSDVDLLFSPTRWTDVERLLSALEATSRTPGGVRLDGEVLLPDGGAVAWRELASRPHRLLVKGPRGAGLRAWKDLTALFAGAPA